MTHEPVLVTYGSKRGGTAEISQWIGEALRAADVAAEVKPAGEVHSIDGYGAVIVGGALYSGRWHSHTRRFVRRFTKQLRQRPVWMFASGPLDNSTAQSDPGKVFGIKAVHKAAERADAREFTVFGGRLEPGARGFPASAMAKKVAGDYRDHDRIRAWATGIAVQLTHPVR